MPFNLVQGQKIKGDTPEYIFTTYTAADGLASAEILSIALDQKGFLWAGTAAGLSRYDGYSFSNFTYSSDNHFIGMVNVIKTDTAGKLWIGASSGLYCYIQNRVIKINTETNSPQAINDIFIEGNGSLWLATESGPAFIAAGDLKNGASEKITLQNFLLPQWAEKFAPLYGTQCQLINQATDGTVYFSHQYQLFRYMNKGIQLVHSTKQENDKIEVIFPVSSSVVFYNAAMTGLNSIKKDIYTDLEFENLYQPERKPANKGIWYVGSLGLVCFHPDEEFISASIDLKAESGSWFSSVLLQDHTFWLATHNGLIKIKPTVFDLHKGEQFANIVETFSFCQLKDGRFLAGANHGEIYHVTKTASTNFLPPGLRPVPHAEIKCMYEDARGWLWIGTGYQGIALYRKGNAKNKNGQGELTRFSEEGNKLHDNSFSSFFISDNLTLFAVGDKGMTEIQVDEKEHISFKPYHYRPRITKYARFYNGVQAPDGTIWIGGEEGLCFLLNDSLVSFPLLKKNISVRSIRITKDNTVWIATAGEGIISCRFNERNKLEVIKQYNEKDGLTTLQFLDLMIDSQDNVWAGSVKGLSFISSKDPGKARIVNFNKADGFISPGYYTCRIYQDRSGKIWVGTSKGIASFQQQDLLLTASPAKVYLTGLEFLKETNVVINSDSIIAANIQHKFSLPYYNNSVIFSYTAVDADAEGIQYYYRLNGLDTNWVNALNRRNAAYYNLPAGNYVFTVKAINGKGYWSKEANFAFVIQPALWQIAWFRLLCISLVILGIYFFIKKREKFIAEQEAQKTAIEKLKAASYQYQLEIEQVINYFATSINQQNSMDDMLWDVARNCISRLGFEDCVIYLLDEKRNRLIQKAAWGPKTTEENKIVAPIEITPGDGIVGSVALSGKPEIIDDTSLDERYIVDDARRYSEITVPLKKDKKIVGVIDSEHSKKNFYTQRHLQILTTIASLLGNKIEQMNAEQQTREKEIEVLKLNKDLATWQITALRAQMNPHFIFNAMNSIQQFTLMNDSDNANLYISKFSTLLRKVLHSSQQNNISLEEEMEQLQLYLDIEKLRMGHDFFYEVTADEEIETDALKIPGMLVQPFVENAVKHGLALKEGDKKLSVHFFVPDESHLHVTINDNGIGRRRSEELKSQQKLLPHISKGIQLVKERLQLLEQKKNHHATIYIEDLLDDAGTKVTVVIPVA